MQAWRGDYCDESLSVMHGWIYESADRNTTTYKCGLCGAVSIRPDLKGEPWNTFIMAAHLRQLQAVASGINAVEKARGRFVLESELPRWGGVVTNIAQAMPCGVKAGCSCCGRMVQSVYRACGMQFCIVCKAKARSAVSRQEER